MSPGVAAAAAEPAGETGAVCPVPFPVSPTSDRDRQRGWLLALEALPHL